MKKLPLAGQRFGRLVALAPAPNAIYRNPRWSCRCDCGRTIEVFTDSLRTGNTKSCGCLRRETTAARSTTHGLTKGPRGTKRSAEFSCWSRMKGRCTNRRNADWPRYGGRGITVCARWRDDYAAFLADVGPRPSALHSLDRIDNMRGYEPGNVRWAVKVVQANNTRRNRSITFDGHTRSYAEWEQALGVTSGTIRRRLWRGWSVHDALTRPTHRST